MKLRLSRQRAQLILNELNLVRTFAGIARIKYSDGNTAGAERAYAIATRAYDEALEHVRVAGKSMTAQEASHIRGLATAAGEAIRHLPLFLPDVSQPLLKLP